ncbi:Glycoside hydrolase [Macleaya cordata]|uniref:mannan endo-1,4-beta-mannosidase n=1 Tax=Macleaya cordata TaxID=56857 RepID=A0A200QBC2_MACCD|nr:Glycoside hydrolase [Macleaya cordata]
MSMGDFRFHYYKQPEMGFVGVSGTQFMLDGKPFYANGWNSYWLMDQAVEDFSRHRVRKMFQLGAKMGLSVCRTWAFNDGAYNALQISPGRFDERVFKGLDHVIAEARQNGVRLILSLVNNLQPFGGKTQYVKWAWEEGIGLSASNDSFFFDPSIRNYFKTYIKTVLTRKNSINGIEYRNDPTILAWELMNEPRCMSDPSGDTLQDWIEEMSSFVKSIDKNHLLTVGLEGFYGPTTPEKLNVNPEEWAGTLGSDFIRNSKIPNIDFASVHVYPDHWFKEIEMEEHLKFVTKWVVSHIDDGEKILKKPVLFTEFGMSNQNKYFNQANRERIYKTIFDIIHRSARKKKSGAGAFIWQLMVGGMEEYSDDFGIVPSESPSLYRLITKHSCKLAVLQKDEHLLKRIPKEMCQR